MKKAGIALGGGMAFGVPKIALGAVGIIAIFGLLYIKEHATQQKTQV